MKKYEKEFVKVLNVPMLHGGTAKKVEMVISEGKLLALHNALAEWATEKWASPVAKDLLAMFLIARQTFRTPRNHLLVHLNDAVRRLESLINSNCECDNIAPPPTADRKSHEATMCFLCEYRAAIAEAERVEKACRKCGTPLDSDGYCGDVTCPYYDHLQDETWTEG